MRNWNSLSVLIYVTLGLAVGLPLGFVLASSAGGGHETPPWLDVVHKVCTSIGGLGTFIALIIVIRQFNLLRAQSDLVQKNVVASLDGQLYARLDSFNKFIVEHDKEYELLNQPYPLEESPERRSKLHHLCDLGFTFYEEIYKHHVRYQLLDTEDWNEWQENMLHFFGKPYVRGYWKHVAGRYAQSFQRFASGLAAKMESTGSPLAGPDRPGGT
jgi:hypothetical protein